MLDIAFDEILAPSIPKKSSPTKRKERKSVTGASLMLGDPKRLRSLPDEVNEEFLELYQEFLDEMLRGYITKGQLTLTQAARYKEYIFDTVFGNTQHLGLFQFVKAKSEHIYNSEKEMVTAAESLLMKGWTIMFDDGAWWVLSDGYDKMLEVTGSSTVSREAAGAVFTPDTAHLFLSDDIASKVSALARRAGFDADALASVGQLDLLLGETDNKRLAGYLMNYNALRFLLKKSGKYSNAEGHVTYQELYDEGYRVGSQIFYPTLSRVVMEKGQESMVLTPVESSLHPEYHLNESLLAVTASEMRSRIYSSYVVPEVLKEVNEMGYTVALMSDFWTSDTTRGSFTDNYELLLRMEAGHRTGSVRSAAYNRARAAFAEMLITEVYFLGNTEFSLSSFGFDPVSGKFFVYAGINVFRETPPSTEAPTLRESSGEFFETCLLALTPSFVHNNIQTLVSYTRESFRSNLMGVSPELSMKDGNVNRLLENFEATKVRLTDALH